MFKNVSQHPIYGGNESAPGFYEDEANEQPVFHLGL